MMFGKKEIMYRLLSNESDIELLTDKIEKLEKKIKKIEKALKESK